MTVVHDPASAGQMVFGEGATAEDLIEAPGIEAKLEAISGKIASRLGMTLEQARNRRDSETGVDEALVALRPWADQEIPENVVSSAEQQFYANDRVISALLAHLVEHVVIGEELRSIAASARRRAADELDRVPPVMVDFVNRLMASGVVIDDVRKMSRQRLAAVVAAIKGVEEASVMPDVEPVPMGGSAIPDKAVSAFGDETVFFRNDSDEVVSGNLEGDDQVPGSLSGEMDDKPELDSGLPAVTVVPEPVEAALQDVDGVALEDGSEQGSGIVGMGDLDASHRSDDTLMEPVSEPVDELALEAPVAPRPKGRWDDIDLTPLGYRIEEAVASSDADREALRIRLPDVSSLREMALPKSPEVMMADGVEGQKDRIIYDKFVRRYTDRTGERMSEMERRIIALLLVDLPTGGVGRMIGANGWYHGIVLPGPEGSTRVRRVWSIDQSEQAIADAMVR